MNYGEFMQAYIHFRHIDHCICTFLFLHQWYRLPGGHMGSRYCRWCYLQGGMCILWNSHMWQNALPSIKWVNDYTHNTTKWKTYLIIHATVGFASAKVGANTFAWSIVQKTIFASAASHWKLVTRLLREGVTATRQTRQHLVTVYHTHRAWWGYKNS